MSTHKELSHLEALQRKHEALHEAVDQAYAQYADDLELQHLKKHRLAAKDRLLEYADTIEDFPHDDY